MSSQHSSRPFPVPSHRRSEVTSTPSHHTRVIPSSSQLSEVIRAFQTFPVHPSVIRDRFPNSPTFRSVSLCRPFPDHFRRSPNDFRSFPGHSRPSPDHFRPVHVHFMTIQRLFQVVSCSFHDRLLTIQDRFPAISGRFLTISGHFMTL